MRQAVSIVALVIAATAPVTQANASSGGYTGASTSGCAGCHGAVADANMTLALTGPASLAAGAAGTYTLTATKSGVSGQPMGLDVSTTDGSGLSVIVGQSTQVIGAELTHTSPPRTVSGTTGTYQFTFTMPAAAGAGSAHTLRAASAIDYPGGWRTTTFTVYVPPTAPSTLNASGAASTSVNLSWSGGGPNYRAVYKTGASAPVSATDGTTVDLGAVTSTTLTGLSPSTQYTARLYSKIAGQNVFSTSGPTATFTTLATAPVARYVNAATGVNAGNCSVPASPCKTITYAMSQAVAGAGDSINVAPGTYNVALGEAFPISFKSGVALVSTGTPANTVIDGTGDPDQFGLIFVNGVSGRLEGFTLANGVHQATGGIAQGGAMRIFSAPAAGFTVTRNVFSNNEARGDPSGGLALGGALYVSFSDGIVVTNNVFSGNAARGGAGGGDAEGGGIFFDSVTGSATNNTFRGNSAIGGNGGGLPGGNARGGGAAGNSTLTIVNNIFAANAATAGTGSPAGTATAGAAATASGSSSNNLTFGNTVNGSASSGDALGTSTVTGDPAFQSAPSNLHILLSSPAAGAGTATGAPATDHDGTTRPNPPSIGAFEPSNLTYNLVLEGYQQVGPYVATPATGSGTATYNGATRQLTFNLTYSGLTGTESMAHVHGPAARGANAGVLHNLSGANPKTDTVVLTAQQQTQLLAGELYVNIHTSTYGNGELRAQIDNVGATVTRALTVNKGGTGTGTVAGTTEAGTVVSCGSDCGENVPHGKAATLTATPSAGSTFGGWSGACTGTGQCVVTMDAAKAVTATFTQNANPPRLFNISTRGPVLTGDNVLIGGFIIQGSTNKQVVIRARGPSMAALGVPGTLANPQLALYSGQTPIASNDNWGDAANAAAITASGFAPENAQESAILTSLAPGPYTAIVTGVGNTTGIAIVEVFEVDAPNTPLINISTRGIVQTGDHVMIGGIIIQGDGPQTVVIRARGPSMAALGVPGTLANPQLALYSGQTPIASNDNWGDAANAAAITASTFAPTDPNESAILITLQPGAYTAIVTGVGGGTGIAIVEVFRN